MALPRRPQDITVLIQNVSKNTLTNPHYDSSMKSNWDASTKIAELFLAGKLKYMTSEKLGVLYMGSNNGRNILLIDDPDSGRYKDIEEVQSISPVSFRTLKLVCEKDENKIDNVPKANILDALQVAATMIEEVTKGKVFTKKINVITDDSLVDFGDEHLDKLCTMLKEANISVNILGIGNYFNGLSDSPSSIETKLVQICDKTDGQFVGGETALEVYTELRNKALSTTTTFRGVLEIGDKCLGIPLWVFKLTEKPRLPSAVKMSQLSNGEGGGKVTTDRLFKIPEKPDEVLTEEETIMGFKYGKNIVPMNEFDRQQLSYKAEKGLKLLGFTEQSKVPRHHFMSEAYICIPPYNDHEANTGFSAMINAMASLDMVAIVRYQRTNREDPRLALLTPYFKKDYDCLIMVFLPYYEDMRQFPFRSFKNIEHTSEQLQSMEDIITSMNLEHDGRELLKPNHIYNGTLHYLYQCIHDRSKNNSTSLPEMSTVIKESCLPDQVPGSICHSIQESVQDLTEKSKKLFDLTLVEESESKKRKYWFALESTSIPSLEILNVETVAEPPLKKRRVEDLGQDNDLMQDEGGEIDHAIHRSLFDRLADKIGTTDPVKDFKDMISRTDKDMTDIAIDQMKETILTLLKSSIGDQLFEKAMNSIKILRDGCIKEQESPAFNSFLRKLKEYLQYNNKNFLEIIQDQVTLISKEDAVDSEISKEDAESFWSENPVQIETQGPTLEGEEHLFDEID